MIPPKEPPTSNVARTGCGSGLRAGLAAVAGEAPSAGTAPSPGEGPPDGVDVIVALLSERLRRVTRMGGPAPEQRHAAPGTREQHQATRAEEQPSRGGVLRSLTRLRPALGGHLHLRDGRCRG